MKNLLRITWIMIVILFTFQIISAKGSKHPQGDFMIFNFGDSVETLNQKINGWIAKDHAIVLIRNDYMFMLKVRQPEKDRIVTLGVSHNKFACGLIVFDEKDSAPSLKRSLDNYKQTLIAKYGKPKNEYPIVFKKNLCEYSNYCYCFWNLKDRQLVLYINRIDSVYLASYSMTSKKYNEIPNSFEYMIMNTESLGH